MTNDNKRLVASLDNKSSKILSQIYSVAEKVENNIKLNLNSTYIDNSNVQLTLYGDVQA